MTAQVPLVTGPIRRLCRAGLRGCRFAEDAIDRARSLLVPVEYEPAPLRFLDLWIAAACATAGAAIAAWAGTAFDLRVNDYWNIYFHADPNRVIADTSLAPWEGFQRKGGVHPIFSITLFPILKGLGAVGLGQHAAFMVLLVACAAMSAGLFYPAMRRLGLSVAAALAFTGAFLASATFLHWTPYIETFAFALLSGVVMLFLATSSRHRLWPWALGSAGTLAVTITNWSWGLAAALFGLKFRKFLIVTATALWIVVTLALVQKAVMPASDLFFDPRVIYRERNFTQAELEKTGKHRWSLLGNARSALVSSAVAPPPAVEDEPTPYGVYRIVTNQHSPPWQSVAGAGAIVCWILLLAAGLWGSWRARTHRAVAMAAGSFMLFQLGICLVYGEVTFLYAANFFPALLTLAAFGWFTPLRRYVVAAAAVFTMLAGLNNFSQFRNAASLANDIAADYPDLGRPCQRLTERRLCE